MKRPCPVCGGEDRTILFHQTFSEFSGKALLNGYDVTCCNWCGCGFADGIPGQAEFDAVKVDAAFAQWADTAQKLPSLFPDGSKTGGDNRASPKIWVDKKDFDAKAAAFGKSVAENRDKGKGSLDGLRAAISAVGKACDDCHKEYRLGKD